MQRQEPPWTARGERAVEPDDPAGGRSAAPSRPGDDSSSYGGDATSGGGAGTAPPIFADGDLVTGRFRIVRFLARGGAGEVYEAQDVELGTRVALKAMRCDPGSQEAIERFKREINLARQVTHPNVCRIYEFGVERRGKLDVLFLTMEFLEGETLAVHIHRKAKLRPAEALPLVRQMAAGLRAAQKAGVIHRDFKSANVMLVPGGDEEDGGREKGLRAVITDFGLAKTAAEDDAGPQVTARNLILGTPAYMAPEQVESGPISVATDLYSVGVVLYEMMTGHTPFEGETGLQTALLRLKQDPVPPRLYNRDLDPRWEAAILRCLERDPADRFAHAGELVAALEAAPAATPTPAQRPRRRLLAALAGLAAAVVVAAGWWLWPRAEAPSPAAEPGIGTASHAAATAATRRSLALLGFKNLSGRGDAAWLSTALEEMLATEAAAGDRIRVVSGDDVARARFELGLEPGEDLTAATLTRVGQLLGCDLLVLGSYLVAGGGNEIRLDLRLRDTASGEVVARISRRGTEETVLDLVEDVGRRLRDVLGVGAISAQEFESMRATLPAGPEAARLYAEGIAQLRVYDARAALERLQEAAEIDPENPLVHSALAAAWSSLGYLPKARDATRRAFELAGNLGRRDRLWVEARYHDQVGDRRQAAEIYGRLWDLFPDDVEYGLRLARAQTALGDADAALETVEKLRRNPVSGTTDLRIDLAEASAARSLSQYERQRDSARSAAAKAEDLGARLLVARAREVEAGAWRDLGELERALLAHDEAREIYRSANNRGAVARNLIAVAKIRRHQGRFDEARALTEEALRVAREIGDRGSMKHALNTLAIMLRQQGKLSEALAMHEMELQANREVGDSRSVQVALTSLGVVERRMGELAAAAARFQEALALGRESGNNRSTAINLNLLGEVRLRQGRLAEAEGHFREALAVNEQTGSPRGRAYYITSLADVELEKGDLAAARGNYEEALEIRRSLGEGTNIAYSLTSLARLELLEGRPQRAAELAAEAAAEFRREGKPDAEAYAILFVVDARLEEGRRDDADKALEGVWELLEGSENREVPLAATLPAAELDAAAGRLGAARRMLRETIEEASRLEFFALELEAGLLLGRIELEAGERGAGEERLAGVARRAADRGFRRLAEAAGQTIDQRGSGPGP